MIFKLRSGGYEWGVPPGTGESEGLGAGRNMAVLGNLEARVAIAKRAIRRVQWGGMGFLSSQALESDFLSLNPGLTAGSVRNILGFK